MPRFALDLHLALHRVDDILRDAHAEARPLDLVDPVGLLAAERIENLSLEFRRHANAVVLDQQAAADEIIPARRGLLMQLDLDVPALRGEFNRV